MSKKRTSASVSGAGAWRLDGRAGILMAAGLLASLPACDTTTGPNGPNTNGTACETDSDCAGQDPNTSCGAEKVCVPPQVAAECAVNQDCLANDANTICRKSDFKCVPLKTPECTRVVGDLARDDAFLFGSVLPLTGDDDGAGRPIELAILLALGQIEALIGGLPTETPGEFRPLIYVGCDDKSDPTGATSIVAAQHLSEVLEAPAIIGEAFSASTIAIANNVTIPNGTLLMSPSAGSDMITTLADNDLVWRTAPPDSLQAAALKLYVPEVEVKVREDFNASMLPINTPVKVAVINNTGLDGKGLADAVVSGAPGPALVVNGKPIDDPANMPYYARKEYDAADAATRSMIAGEMAGSFQPHIILLFGSTEVLSIITLIEAQWPANDPQIIRPRYVLPDALLRGDVAAMVGMNDSLRLRISGTVPGTNTSLFSDFVDDYSFKWGAEGTAFPPSFGAAGGYDSVFLLAYATATLGIGAETGAGLAEGLKKLVHPPGPVINAGEDKISAGFAALRGMGGIDFAGVSGPLTFDLATGEAKSDIQIWCLPKTVSGAAAPSEYSGLYYNYLTGQLSESIGLNCD